MTPPLTPQAFVAKWRAVALHERGQAQEHFIDLCRLLGQPTPTEADPGRTWFMFEAGATKATGGQGWADVWRRDCFAWEYKGDHADLDKAYAQLLLYSGALANPPLLIVCDGQRFRIHTHFTNTVRTTYEFTVDDLLQPAKLDLLRHAFTAPEALRGQVTPDQVTEQAAAQFARIAQILRRYAHPPQAVAHFLIRLLFCLFAEDVGLLPPKLFTRLVTQPGRTTAALTAQLRQLFAALATGGCFGVEAILHVDGGLFNDDTVLPLDSDSLRILAAVCGLDWAAIEPAIVGTLFQRGLDPGKRSQLGAHFTAKDDILLIVEPVLMAPLRREWAAVQSAVQALQDKLAALDASADARRTVIQQQTWRSERTRLQNQASALLRDFRHRLAAIQTLDPACGSGNFLYVALRLLLDLEKEVITLATTLGESLAFPLVSPAQLHGIEINPYACELAQATVWIGYIQWLRDNGFGRPAEPILQPLTTIRLMDAIITLTPSAPLPPQGEGPGVRITPAEPTWPAADVIIGNPPFLGGGKIRAELGDAYTDALFKLYGDRLPNFSDLVCYWFEKARAQVAAGKAKRVGLLATQGIRGGANRNVLERIKATGGIFWAVSDRDWVLDGAAVHVSMVGFDNGEDSSRWLDNGSVANINPDLTASVDLTQAEQLLENSDIGFIGPSPKAPFDIEESQAEAFLAAPQNPNGRSNADVVRPVVSGIDIVQGSRRKWTIDFGLISYEEAVLYEDPFEYVRSVILPIRKNRRDDYRGMWWQYARPRPEMRAALNGLPRFVATARIAKHRVFVWLSPNVLPNDQTVVFARADDYFFGVLHSRPHELWALRLGTQLREAESGFRYTPTTCFETFPFPWPPGSEPADDPRVAAIAAAARELVRLRDAWLNPPGADAAELKKRTLTNLYNARPAWLDLAHKQLDVAVLAAYGWPADLGDAHILERLLALNLARAQKG